MSEKRQDLSRDNAVGYATPRPYVFKWVLWLHCFSVSIRPLLLGLCFTFSYAMVVLKWMGHSACRDLYHILILITQFLHLHFGLRFSRKSWFFMIQVVRNWNMKHIGGMILECQVVFICCRKWLTQSSHQTQTGQGTENKRLWDS